MEARDRGEIGLDATPYLSISNEREIRWSQQRRQLQIEDTLHDRAFDRLMASA
jgi:hypothetical protein